MLTFINQSINIHCSSLRNPNQTRNETLFEFCQLYNLKTIKICFVKLEINNYKRYLRK